MSAPASPHSHHANPRSFPGAAEDVLRSLQALPGVTSVSDFSSQLVVRGSGPDQNLILIDDFEVLNPYRLYGFVSMFNPETVSDISLQTGGFSAQYGDRFSAVLDVKNREGRTDVPVGGKVNTSLTNMNVILEGRVPGTPGSYLFSARRTYYDLILGPVLKSAKLVQGDVALPNFRDLQGKIVMPLGGTHKLLFNLFTSRDGVELVSGSRARPARQREPDRRVQQYARRPGLAVQSGEGRSSRRRGCRGTATRGPVRSPGRSWIRRRTAASSRAPTPSASGSCPSVWTTTTFIRSSPSASGSSIWRPVLIHRRRGSGSTGCGRISYGSSSSIRSSSSS